MTDGPGLATNHIPDGVRDYQKLRDAGFQEDELHAWVDETDNKLKAAGFKPSERAAYWGNGDPEDRRLVEWLTGNVARNGEHIAQNPGEAFIAGWQMGNVGMIAKGGRPDTVLKQKDLPLGEAAAGAAGQLLGDLPASIAGFVMGSRAGAAVGGAAGGLAGPEGVPVGAAIGSVVTGGAASAATPEAVRQVLLDAYDAKDGNVRTWQDAAKLAIHSLAQVGKAGTVGAVSAGLGGAAGAGVARVGGGPAVALGVNTGVMVTSATATAAALEGHVPDKQDFVIGAATALAFHAGSKIAGGLSGPKANARVQHNLETIYKETGVHPRDVVEMSRTDPMIAQELLAQDIHGRPVTPGIRELAAPEPPPFKPAIRGEEKGPVLEGEVLPKEAKFAATPQEAKQLLIKLEGSKDDSVSPAGAIGKHQIMPGTARQYMGDSFDVKTLFDPKVNEMVANKIIADLHKRYNGDMTAIAVAYNAGPGRAGQYLTKGPGTRLKAIPDKKVRGGVRYEQEPSTRDESFLPLETQRYLANGRRRSGGEMPGGGGSDGPEPKFPSYELAVAEGAGGGSKPPGDDGGPPHLGSDGPRDDGFWAKASEETLTEEMLSNVGEPPKPPSLANIDRIMDQYVSELTPARNVDRRLTEAGDLDPKRDLTTEDMFRQTYASDIRAGVFVRYGAIDPITLNLREGSPSVLQATKAVKEDGGNFDGWLAYMLARRTVDKAGQGIETGLNPKAATALAGNKKAARKYERATKLFNDVMTSALDYSKESGVHSADQVARMVRDNPTYISMRRVMGDDESFSGGGRGFGPRDTLRKMEGSDRSIVDPIAATIDNLRLIIKMADRNRAIGHIIGYVERGKLSGLTRLEWNPKATIAEAGSNVFKPYGVDPVAGAETYGPLLAERAQRGFAENEFIYYRNGQAEKWRAESPELARLLRKADTLGEANIVTETFGFFAKLKRSGIVSTPGYAGRAIFRDQMAAFVLDPAHPAPFATFVEGLVHVLGATKAYKDAQAKGAIGGALSAMDADWLARDMHKLLGATGVFEGVVNAVKHPIELAQIINEKLDAANRVGYHLQAQRKGYEPIKAATMARKAYLDFAERATSNVVNWMAKVTPFFRPTILGGKQLGEALHERPVETLTFATAGIAVPTAIVFMLNWAADQELPEGERWKDLPLWQRDTHLITPPIAGVRFRLPYPQDVGMMFGGMVNRILDALANDNPRAFKELHQSVLNTFVPDLVPAIAAPVLEAETNHSFFTGKPLIPSSVEDRTGYMQYTAATSETGKAVARALGPAGADIVDFSPIQFDNFVRGWTGTVGTQLLKALDIPSHAEKKPYELADIPFVGSFMVRHPGTSSQPISDFYDETKRLERYSADFRAAMDEAEQGGDPAMVTANAAASQYASAVAPIKDVIGTMSDIIQGINKNEDMSDVEKRQAIDVLTQQMIQVAEMGLKAIDQLPKRDLHPKEAEGPGIDTGLVDRKQSPPEVPEVAPLQGMVPVS